MSKETIIQLVLWTMKYYGSEAGDRAKPGSKLQSQAEHIADVIEEYNQAQLECSKFHNVSVVLTGHNL